MRKLLTLLSLWALLLALLLVAGGWSIQMDGISPFSVTIRSTGLITSGSTVVGSLPSAASNPFAQVGVTDSTAVAAEGQTCVGGSSNKAIAISNGTVWKCF